MPHHVFPAQERRRGEHDQPVGRLADDGEGDDGGDDLGRLAELLAVDQQIAEAFRCTHQLGKPAEIVAAIVAFAIVGKATDWLIVLTAAPFLRWEDVVRQD